MAEYSLEDATGMVIYKVGMKEVQESVNFVRSEMLFKLQDKVITNSDVKILFAFGDIGIRCDNASKPQKFSLYIPSFPGSDRIAIHPKALPLILHRFYTEFAPRDYSNWFIVVKEEAEFGSMEVIDTIPTDSWVDI